MTAHHRIAGLALGLLLFAVPTFAAGRTLPLETAVATGARVGASLGRFPVIESLEAAPLEQASRIPLAPIDADALAVPPGRVAAVITSIATGTWSSTATWSGGVVPSSLDDVVIADGTTVTINTGAACATLAVGQGTSGILQYETTTARALTVGGSVTIAAGGTFQSAATGTVITHSLSVGGNLTNNGALDFSTNLNTAGANITFTGAANATFGGLGGTTDIRTITVNKASGSVLELNPTNFTVRGAANNAAAANGMLAITNGTFKLGGTFAGSNTLGTIAGWSVPASGGLWLANPNYTVVAQNGTVTINGSLIMDAGTFNVGTMSGNRLAYVLGSVVTINGGAINISGRFSPTSNGVAYTQSGGTLTVTTIDNASTTNSGFDLQSGSTFTMSGGAIVVQRSASVAGGPRDYRNFASTITITGGTLQLGNGSSPGAQTFTIQGWAPAVSVTNLGGNHIALLGNEVDAFGTTTIAANAKLTLNGQFYVERGAAIVNNGTIDGSLAGSNLYFFGSSPQTYFQSGVNGTVAAPLAALDVDNLTTLTFNVAATTTIASRVNMFTGGIVNANKLQLGVGGTSAAVTQIGTAGNVTTGGTYDVSPNYAFGTGGYILLYEPETLARTTGAEIPSGRAIATLSVNNTHDVALAGGDVAVGTLSFPAASKNLTTGANTVTINAGGTVSRVNPTTSGWVVGNLAKDVPTGTPSRTFEIGTANYAPVAVALSAVTAAGTLTGRTDDGDLTIPAGSGLDTGKSVNRNWTLTGGGGLALGGATGTFNFTEVDGGANTSNFVVRKLDGTTWISTTPGARTPTSTQATWNSGFSRFAIGELASYPVNVSVVGSGSVAKNPDLASYTFGSTVELTATPAPGWHFVGWSGEASGSANPLNVTVDAAKNLTATFAIDQFALNVTVVGNGSVAKNPDQPLYGSGSIVELTATPAVGWHFVGWSGDASGSANPLNVTVDAAKNITATFAIDQYALNVSVVGNGSVAKNPDQPLYDSGSIVELTATPAVGWHFVGWSGDASGSANPLNVTVDAAKNITATFAIDQYALDVTVVGNGSVAKSPDQPLYDFGSIVELTATPAVGWHFVGWSGDASGSANPLNVTVDAAKSITATFAIDQYALNVTVVGNGSVAKNPDQPLYDSGSIVELTATADPGWHFVGWSGDASGSANPLNVTVDAAKNITATFASDQYALSVTVVGNGSVAKNPDQPLYDSGSIVELTATADPGWHFVGWSGDASGSTNPLNVTVDAAKNITATFAIDQYALNVTVVGNGSVAKNPDQPLYDSGSIVELTATADPGWHFVGWSGDASGSTNPLSVTVDATKNITATFAIDQYALNVSIVGNGSVAKVPDQVLYEHGTEVELTATPAPGYHFVGWSGDIVTPANPLLVAVNGDLDLTATFAIDEYAVNLTVVGHGVGSRNPDRPYYATDSIVELTATPDPGWHFVGWSGDATGNTNPLNVTVDGEKNITATFAIDQYAVNVAVVGNGAVTKNPDQPLYDSGSIVELTATADPGWHFVGWSGDAAGSTSPLNVTVDAAKNITATFAIDQYALNVSIVGNGTVAKVPDQVLYDHGTEVELTATPAPGYHFVGWSGDIATPANPLLVAVNSDLGLTATFAIDEYAVNLTVVGHGVGSRNPDRPYYATDSIVELTATPDPGWHFVGWSGDASGNTNPLNVTVDGEKNITATFAIDQYAVNVTVVGNGAVAKNPDQPLYDSGSIVELTATPAVGWHFVGWSGDAAGSTSPLNVTVDAAKNITATFAINQYALDVSVVGNGSVATDPVQASYDHGASVQLTATADPGWEFAAWSGDASGNASPLNVVMDGSKSITATFRDATVPTAHLLAPNTSAGVMAVGATQAITWTASDNVDVTAITLLLSRAGTAGPFEVLASGIANTGSYDWLVTGPPTANALIRVVAQDVAENEGSDDSDQPLEIVIASVGVETPVVKFALLPVIPSPSVGNARLRYELPKDADVDLTIVDVRGREVAKLVHGTMPAGRHTATWNGQTTAGRAAAGVYFARCLTPGARLMQRIVLLR